MNATEPPYQISRADAVYLHGLMNGLGGDLPPRTNEDLVALLRETLKMAVSVTSNTRDWLELMGILHADLWPEQAEKLNCPTIEGALAHLIAVPRVPECGQCPTCAFRIGSPAAQVPATADDILGCLDSGDDFLCHHTDGLDDIPSRPCLGFRALKGAIGVTSPAHHQQPEEVEEKHAQENHHDPEPTI